MEGFPISGCLDKTRSVTNFTDLLGVLFHSVYMTFTGLFTGIYGVDTVELTSKHMLQLVSVTIIHV